MSMILTVLAASALVRALPAGSSPSYWVNDLDYPEGARRRREEGTVGLSMLIDPDGNVSRCFVSTSSGFPELDQRTCAVMLVRTKFKPARDENGKPVYDTYTAFLTWRLPGQSRGGRPLARPVRPPDMILEVRQLPEGETERIVGIIVRTDDNGRVAYCEANPSNPPPPQLSAVACAQMKASYVSDLTDEAGKSVPAIQGINIAFRVPPK